MSPLKHTSTTGTQTYTADLSQLYNDGYISVTNFTSLDPSFNIIADIFDGDNTTASMIVIDSNEVSTSTKITFNDPKKPTLVNRVTINVGVILRGRIVINEGENDSAEYTWDTGRTTYQTTAKEIIIDITPVSKLKFLRIYYDDYYEPQSDSLNDVRLYGVSVSGTVINDSDLFEFNDSVLTTKAWNSSRYNGKQLQGAVINEFRAGDSTYGKTPVLRNYTRNIYVGSDIINVSSSVNDTLMEIPNFCYVTINKFLTINDDNTITENIIESKDNNFDLKNGWYRSFYDDFPEQSNCKIILNNLKSRSNLKENYKIYFNGGQLQKILQFEEAPNAGFFINENIYTYTTASNETYVNIKATAGLGYWRVYFYNEEIYNDFFSGKVNPDGYLDGSSAGSTNTQTAIEPFNEFFEYKTNSSYKGDKRLFATFFESSSNYLTHPGYPLRTIGSGSIPEDSSVNLQSNNLAELSTIEIVSSSAASSYIRLHTPNKVFLNQNYDTTKNSSKPINAEKGVLMVTKAEDTVPSLLLNIPYNKTFPNGIENTDFVVIPENLHPYIKDNLAYFLTRAGIDVGGNTSTLISLDQTNRYPDRIGWKPPKPAPTPELQAAQDAKTEITFEQRRLLARQLAEQNRRRFLERLKEEEENQRRNKRQSKRKGRQEDREERRALREERKENRRENRQENRDERREQRENRRNRRRNR